MPSSGNQSPPGKALLNQSPRGKPLQSISLGSRFRINLPRGNCFRNDLPNQSPPGKPLRSISRGETAPTNLPRGNRSDQSPAGKLSGIRSFKPLQFDRSPAGKPAPNQFSFDIFLKNAHVINFPRGDRSRSFALGEAACSIHAQSDRLPQRKLPQSIALGEAALVINLLRGTERDPINLPRGK